MRHDRQPNGVRRKRSASTTQTWLLFGAVGLLALIVWIVISHQDEGSTDAVPPIPRAEERPVPPAPLPAPIAPRAPAPVPVPILSQPQSNVIPPQPMVTQAPKPAVPAAPMPLSWTQSPPKTASTTLEVQVALVRMGFSPGSIDGVFGSQTRSALAAFQSREGLPATGEVDPATRSLLWIKEAVEENYVVSSNDFSGLQPLSPTWLGKSQQTSLAYETVLESLAERSLASPALLVRMNPGVSWTNLAPGTVVRLPSAKPPPPQTTASLIRIRLGARTLTAHDASGNLILHAPCSIARRVEKRPVGRLFVASIAVPPNYTFDPENFPESAEARTLGRKIILPPGPNNPVGTAWIGLDRPGYGIHGTPRPEEVGRTESHGCFRLANWNAEHLAKMVRTGVPVEIEP